MSQPDQPTPSHGDDLRGVLAIIASSVLFAAMAIFIEIGKSVGEGISVYQMALFRFAIGVTIVVTLAMGRWITLRFDNTGYLFLRGLFGAGGVFFYYLSIKLVGAGMGTALNYSYPIFATIFSTIFLREHVGPLKWVCIVISFVGIYLMVTPGDLLQLNLSLPMLGGLVGAACSGMAVVIVKKLRASDSSYAIFLGQAAVGFWIAVVPANVGARDIGLWGGVILLLIGLTAAAGQLLMTYGYGHTSVATGSILAFLTPILVVPASMLFFHEEITLRALLGMALVIASSIAVLVIKKRPAPTVAVAPLTAVPD